jgi:hypothetical protein
MRTHNKLNEVTTFGVAPASTPVLYDYGNNSGEEAAQGNGNIVDDGTRQHAYDAFNRLTTVVRESDGETVGQYTYDALGAACGQGGQQRRGDGDGSQRHDTVSLRRPAVRGGA